MGKILVSACLLGRNCKYNGGNNYNPAVAAFLRDKEVLALCPEVMAGLGTPRTPIELVDGVLMDRKGYNVDAPLRAAVEEALAQIREWDISFAILQSRSPTCGVNQVYDGTFSGRLIPGSGVFARALMEAGCPVWDAEDVSRLHRVCPDRCPAGAASTQTPTPEPRRSFMIQKAEPKDLPVLTDLACRLWPHSSPEEMQAEFSRLLAKPDGVCFLAYGPGAPVGFAQCQLRHDYVEGTESSPVGYLEGIYVAEEHRKQGIARALLAACEIWAKEQGCTEFASDCELGNEDSLSFHLNVGFREANRVICFTRKL